MTKLVLLLIFLFRLTLVDRGLMHWWDERMHWFSMRMWADVASGNWIDWLRTPFNPKIQGRPLWIILNMVPAGLQAALFWATRIKTETPTSLHLVGIYNVFLSMIIVVLFWLIAKKLLAGSASVLVAIIVYAFLANSAVYVRQMSPIYSSLILYLTSFLLLLKTKTINWKRMMLVGLLTGLGQLTYASYFQFPVFNITVLIYSLIKARQHRVRLWLTAISGFILGYALPILLLELWARGVGTSIYASIARNPNDIGLNPSLTEAFLFLPAYLVEAEGMMGITLILLSGFLMLIGWRRILRRQPISLAMVLGLTSLVVYGGFALTTIWHHRIYARVIHINILFLIIGIVGAIECIRKQRRYFLLLLVGLISIYSFYGWARVFSGINYPLDIKFRICGTFYRCPDTVVEIDENDTRPAIAIPEKTRFVLVNTMNMFPINQTYSPFAPPSNFQLIFSAPHPLNFVPYQLEGYSPQERIWLRQRAYTIRVYQNTTK